MTSPPELPKAIERPKLQEDDRSSSKKPTGRIIIIGGGRIGRHLMKYLPRAILIESSPATVHHLQELFGKARVFHGDGANIKFLLEAGIQEADIVIITSSHDHVNQKVATAVAPFGVKKVMVRVTNEESFKSYKLLGMEPFKITPALSAKLVERIYNPDMPHVHEFILPAGSHAVGRKVGDLNIPDEVTIVSILRGQHLEVPDPAFKLRIGDVLTVIASDEAVLKLEKLLGARLDMVQLRRIYVPFKGKRTIKYALREAFVLSKYSAAEVTLVYDGRNAEQKSLAKQMKQIFALQDVPLTIKDSKSEVEGGLKRVLRASDCEPKDPKNGCLLNDCVMVDPEKSSLFQQFIGVSYFEQFIQGMDRPIIITGNMNPYKSILLTIDGSDSSDLLVALAVEVAILFGSRIHILIRVGEADEKTERLAQYVIRAGHLHGLQVTEQHIEGNPTLEFVDNVKSGEFDLVVINWRSHVIKRDILRKVVEYGPRSIIVVP